MNKKFNLLSLVVVVYFLTASSFVAAVDRPTYALDPANLPTVLEGYEVMSEMESFTTVGTIESYVIGYVAPPECYPITEGSPPCTSSLVFSYTLETDSDLVEMQNEASFDLIRDQYAIVFASQGFEDVTDDVPGAALAYLYTIELSGISAYTGVAYIGYQTGLFFAIAEATYSPTRGVGDDVHLGALDKSDFINIMGGAAGVAAADLGVDLGGDGDSDDASFGSLVIISSSLMISAIVIRRRRN